MIPRSVVATPYRMVEGLPGPGTYRVLMKGMADFQKLFEPEIEEIDLTESEEVIEDSPPKSPLRIIWNWNHDTGKKFPETQSEDTQVEVIDSSTSPTAQVELTSDDDQPAQDIMLDGDSSPAHSMSDLDLNLNDNEHNIETDNDSTFLDPYDGMPTLENMSRFNLRRTIYNTDKDEPIFVTLARYSFPMTDETMLPGINLDTIFSKSKYFSLRWTGTFSLTDDEKEFLDRFCYKAIDEVEMGEWEQLRDIYLVRDSWFTLQKEVNYFEPEEPVLTVKELRLPSDRLLRHLPSCRTLYRARKLMTRYTCVVNLGSRIDIVTEPFPTTPEKPATRRIEERRSTRRPKRSDSMVDALTFELDHHLGADSKRDDDLTKIDDWPWPFDQPIDSGFDEEHPDPVSIFQVGETGQQLPGLSRDHFQYSTDQLISETGLTLWEEQAFEGLEKQLITYFAVPKRKRYKTSAYYQARKRSAVPLQIDRLVSEAGRVLRSSSRASSELSQLEIISEEKAILISLKVPKEFASIPSAKFLAEHGGKYLREKDFLIDFDAGVPTPEEDRPFEVLLPEEEPSPKEVTNILETGNCTKEFCMFGCVCASINSSAIQRTHCGKLRCILHCICQISKSAHATTTEIVETRDIRLSLRPRARKWKRPMDENVVAKKKVKQSSSVVSDRVTHKTNRFKTVPVPSAAAKHVDYEDNYHADIDRAEVSSEDGTGSFSSSLPPVPVIITLDDTDDDSIEPDTCQNLSEVVPDDDDSLLTSQHEGLNAQFRPVRVLENNNSNVQVNGWTSPTLSNQPVSSLVRKKLLNKRARRVYSPLPLEITTTQKDEATICIVSWEEDHKIFINWSRDCCTPKLSASNDGLTTDLTLPVPKLNTTFYLFKLPSNTDGVCSLHVPQIEFKLPLDKLHEIIMNAINTLDAFRARELRISAKKGRRLFKEARHCKIYAFPSLPQLLVLGPYPVGGSDEGDGTERWMNTEDKPGRICNPTEPNKARTEAEHKWNGDGDKIPKDYLDQVIEDFMIEFPRVGRWSEEP